MVSINGSPANELASSERIALLESCQEHPVRLLIRFGEIHETSFQLLEVRCGTSPSAETLSKLQLASQQCSTQESPEIGLGIAWCYHAKDGLLAVQQVCKGSPAHLALPAIGPVRRAHARRALWRPARSTPP